eukprot:13675825-Heterocapsa_arctica.AAC.1
MGWVSPKPTEFPRTSAPNPLVVETHSMETGCMVKDIFRAVKAGHFCYDPSRWDCLSEQAKDLVDSLIK